MEGCFHESLIIEILCWLPVNSLLRFKRVSKSWYAIIGSRYFIREHLKHKKERHADRSIVPYSMRQARELNPYMSRVIDTNDPDCVIHVNTEKSLTSDCYICGPCDGIYFIWKKQNRLVKVNDDHYLWNPALNEEKKLPPIIRKPNMSAGNNCRSEFLGFGFDPVTEDYKGVVIIEYWNWKYDCPPSVLIYSLRNDSWSYAGDLSKSYQLQRDTCNSFVNTSFYWLGSHDSSSYSPYSPGQYDVIIVVDLVTEASKEIGLPEMEMRKKDLKSCMSYSECLMVYHSSIALVAVYYFPKDSFDIWTLNETTSSWTKELTVELDTSLAFIPYGYHCVNTNIMLFQALVHGIVFWDPYSNQFQNVIITNDEEERNQVTNQTVFVYVKSLIPINNRKFWER